MGVAESVGAGGFERAVKLAQGPAVCGHDFAAEGTERTLLLFNKDFRDADDRDRKLMPPSEPTFMESVTQTSLALMPALEAMAPAPPAIASAAPAAVFEKLITPENEEEEIPST